MSELTCEIVEIKELLPHNNADSLSIVKIYDYPVIVRTEEWKAGDRGVYFPVDAMLPVYPLFSFLWQDREEPTDRQRTVRAIRLRGTFSMGLLIPLRKLQEYCLQVLLEYLEIGTNVAELFGVKKYDPPLPVSMGGECEAQPSWFRSYTDIENVRKYSDSLTIDEEVVITEKIHGTNSRFAYKEGRLWVGSHNLTKKLGGKDVWNVIARDLDLENKLQEFEGFAFCGEIYGGSVQKGFNYGLKAPRFVLFDIIDLSTNKYLDHDEMVVMAVKAGFNIVPLLYRGAWKGLSEVEKLADGSTLTEGEHTREGFVVKPIRERWNDNLGRVIIKLHGQDFLTGRIKKKKEKR